MTTLMSAPKAAYHSLAARLVVVGAVAVATAAIVWRRQSSARPQKSEEVRARALPGLPNEAKTHDSAADIPGPSDAGPRSSNKYDLAPIMRAVQREYSKRKTAHERYSLLYEIVRAPATDPTARWKRAYALRLLGVVASEDEAIAQDALRLALDIARVDADPLARLMAVAAVMGSLVPGQSSDDPERLVYFDRQTLAGTPPFDNGFPEWARASPEFRILLRDLSMRGVESRVRQAAVRAQASIADEESLTELASIVRDGTETAELRAFAVRAYYRSASPQAVAYIREIASGRMPGLPQGYQFEALTHLLRMKCFDPHDEAVVVALASDSSAPPEGRKSAIRLLADVYGTEKTPASQDALSRALRDADVDVRIESLRHIRRLKDRTFLSQVEAARIGESNRLVLDHIHAALNDIDPAGGRRPSLLSQMDELQRLVERPGLSPQELEPYQQAYQRLLREYKALDSGP